ncbi:MAG: phosphosulfolactate synthase, partial [Bacteroidia bacterium]|nr:phosphosulfolactate synthase [Bacteroidia bacterium]
MNYSLNDLPERTSKPREAGITMVMDKGLSINEVENFISMSAEFTDFVKFGWATSFVTANLKDKLTAYKNAGIKTYFGGTLFEAFVVRGQYDDYKKLLDKYDLEFCEVSDGSMTMEHDEKCKYIEDLSKQVTVLSEVGSKDADVIYPPYKWIEFIQKEIEAGAWKVIAEARESGNVGLYRGTGEVRSGLVQEILTKIDQDQILWEAPLKPQQIYFIKLLGANVNLGNIAPNEVIPVETLRLGLRSDTFSFFLNGNGAENTVKQTAKNESRK